MSSNNSKKRVRRFCLTTYIDSPSVLTFLKRQSWVQHWAMITHDKDVNDDGSPKQSHTHILLYTYDGKMSSAVKKRFDTFSSELYKGGDIQPQNTLVQECIDIFSQWRYLRHLDNPEKAQYTLDNVYVDDLSYWNTLEAKFSLNDCADNTALAVVNDMLNGVDTYTLIERYGKDYVYHANYYKSVLFDISSESSKANFATFRDMCDVALAGSDFNDYQIDNFFAVLDYVQTVFSNGLSRNESVSKYLHC